MRSVLKLYKEATSRVRVSVCKGNNPSPSLRHASGRYFQQPSGLRFQRHQRKTNSNSTQRTISCGTPHSIPCYLNKKHKISKKYSN
jgi:hypothetical protein